MKNKDEKKLEKLDSVVNVKSALSENTTEPKPKTESSKEQVKPPKKKEKNPKKKKLK